MPIALWFQFHMDHPSNARGLIPLLFLFQWPSPLFSLPPTSSQAPSWSWISWNYSTSEISKLKLLLQPQPQFCHSHSWDTFSLTLLGSPIPKSLYWTPRFSLTFIHLLIQFFHSLLNPLWKQILNQFDISSVPTCRLQSTAGEMTQLLRLVALTHSKFPKPPDC